MTITAQKILTKLGNSAWSGFNIDDMVFTSDDSAQAREELNRALRFLINLEDFPFKTSSKSLMAISGINKYSVPVGQISEIYNDENNKKLEFVQPKYDKTEIANTTPTSFWIDNKNPKENLVLYPTPDKTYNFTIVFSQFMPVKKQDGTLAFEFTAPDDYINIPSRLEYLFTDCLILRTMAQNNKDEQDENFRPTVNEFWEYWKNFLKACNPVKQVERIVW